MTAVAAPPIAVRARKALRFKRPAYLAGGTGLRLVATANRLLVTIEHRRTGLATVLIILPANDCGAVPAVGLGLEIGAEVSLLDRVPGSVVLPAHRGDAAILVLGATAVGSEVTLFHGLAMG